MGDPERKEESDPRKRRIHEKGSDPKGDDPAHDIGHVAEKVAGLRDRRAIRQPGEKKQQHRGVDQRGSHGGDEPSGSEKVDEA